MSKWKRWAALLPAIALIASGCGGNDEGAAEPTETETQAAPTETEAPTPTETPAATETPTEEPITRAEGDLVIWADDTRTPVIEPFAQQFGEEQGITVVVQEVPFDRIRDLQSTQGPAGEGPDVFIGAHDWLGQLVADGVVAPLDLSAVEGDYLPAAIAAFNYEGQTYGLPYSIENIALVRNTALAPERPGTLAELREMGLAAVDAGEADIPIGWQQPDPYHDYWVVTGAGGYVFGRTDDGAYDPSDLGIDTEGGLKAAQLFGEMAAEGFISQDVTYDVMIDKFKNGLTPFAVTGPWAIGDFAGVDFVVEPFPTIDGGEPAPFVGVQGFMVSSFAANELAAKTFVLDFMGTEDAQTALYEAGNRPPALAAAFEAASSDPVVAGFGEAGKNGYPMPAIPAMGSVWEAWTNAYTQILSGTDATAAFQDAAEQIRNLISAG